jgi:hypothetical protein
MKLLSILFAVFAAPVLAQPNLVAPKCHDPQIWPTALRSVATKAVRYGGDARLNSAFLPSVITDVMQVSADSVTATRVCYGQGKNSFGREVTFAFQVMATDANGRYAIRDFDEKAALAIAASDEENVKAILRRDQPKTLGKALVEREAREAASVSK